MTRSFPTISRSILRRRGGCPPGVAHPPKRPSDGPWQGCAEGRLAWRSPPDVLVATLQEPGITRLSCDIFDTVLLRGIKPEIARFQDIGRLQAAALARRGHCLAARDVFFARLYAHRIEYLTAPEIGGSREGRLDRIVGHMTRLLALPPEEAAVLHDAELQYELSAVRQNRSLLAAIRVARKLQKRVIAISDMYLSRDDMVRLLDCHVGTGCFDAVYVSSEFGCTKHAGSLYQLVAAAEGCDPQEILHVGDNPRADGENAVRLGFRAFVRPRWRLWQFIRDRWGGWMAARCRRSRIPC